MKNIFKKIIVEFQERVLPDLMEREYQIPLDTKIIVTLIGVRRSGKTSILYNVIKQLTKNIDITNIIYMNFEDDRLFTVTISDLDSLVEAYFELYPEKRKEEVYFFLDEIQVVDNWERFVRRIYDTLNIHIYLTGSSSKLLSAEIATSLRGRTISFEIFPFSFMEVLKLKGKDINFHSPSALSYMKNELSKYLIEGGFPECIEEDPMIKRKILSNYMDMIIYKDIIERHNIKNKDLLKHIIKYCFSNLGTLLSFTKLYNHYKTIGLKVSKDALFEYFSYLEEAYVLFKVPIFRESIKEELRNPKKIYAIDIAFKSLFSISFSENYSKIFENLVFLHLRRKTKEIFYYKEKQEVDFYVVINKRKMLINVSYDIQDPDTRNREIGGLLEAMQNLNIKNSCLINSEEESVEEINGFVIEIIPLFKFLLMDL